MNAYRTYLPPTDPLSAVTHPDPSAYYYALATRHPFAYDVRLGGWVAASAAAVSEVLTHPACLVRPVATPIPGHLLGTGAAAFFGSLVRTNDGAAHAALKRGIAGALEHLTSEHLDALSQHWAGRILSCTNWQALPWSLSAHVVGSLLGVADSDLSWCAALTAELAPCFAAAPEPQHLARAIQAAEILLACFESLLLRPEGLLAALADGLPDERSLAANAAGLLWQAFDSSAGLLGNALSVLERQPELVSVLKNDLEQLRPFLLEVLRRESPIQNTRRYVGADTTVAGQPVRAGDLIVLVLAAANLDPAAHPAPLSFKLDRAERQVFTFGLGAHVCPGQRLALSIAEAGLTACLETSLDLSDQHLNFRESVNARLPIWTKKPL